MTITYLCREADIHKDNLHRWIRHGLFPSPNLEDGKKKYYDLNAKEVLLQLIEKIMADSADYLHARARKEGFYSVTDAWLFLDISSDTFRMHLKSHFLKKPTHPYGKHLFYMAEDLQEMEKILETWQKGRWQKRLEPLV